MSKKEYGRQEFRWVSDRKLIPYLEQISQYVNLCFPVATLQNPQSVNLVAQIDPSQNPLLLDTHNFSFAPTNDPFAIKALQAVCQLAMKRYMARSPDQRHQYYPATYWEALQRVFERLSGTSNIPSRLSVEQTRNKDTGFSDYIVCVVYSERRETPLPLQTAIEIADRAHNKSALINNIRQSVLQFGVANGMFTAIYLGLGPEDILQRIFQDENYKKTLSQAGHSQIPTLNSSYDKGALIKIHELLTHGFYQEACTLAYKKGWIPLAAKGAFSTVSAVAPCNARVELSGLMNLVQEEVLRRGVARKVLDALKIDLFSGAEYGNLATSLLMQRGSAAYIIRTDQKRASQKWLHVLQSNK